MTMQLNTLKPAAGAKQKKQIVGRGIGSGSGKTCKRGHKGQRSRQGGNRAFIGFEGGQMPLQRRMPKSGFSSRRQAVSLTLSELSRVEGDVADRQALLDAGLISQVTKQVKVMLSGEITRALTVKLPIRLTKGAKLAVEKAGGRVELAPETKAEEEA